MTEPVSHGVLPWPGVSANGGKLGAQLPTRALSALCWTRAARCSAIYQSARRSLPDQDNAVLICQSTWCSLLDRSNSVLSRLYTRALGALSEPEQLGAQQWYRGTRYPRGGGGGGGEGGGQRKETGRSGGGTGEQSTRCSPGATRCPAAKQDQN